MTREEIRLKGESFENKIFGEEDSSPNLGPYSAPDYLDFPRSLQQIIERNWSRLEYSITKGEGYFHNPIRPTMGKTHDLWSAVKNYLPNRGVRPPLPLNLYVSRGRNSLDYWHGVDLFFWWNGEYVTVDLATKNKPRENHTKERRRVLKSDFIFIPEDLEHNRLLFFGKQVANLLVERENHSKGVEELNFSLLVEKLLYAGLR